MTTTPTKTLHIYTDGACKGKPDNLGGWGAVITDCDSYIKEIFGGEKNTTNNRMELMAVIEALQFLTESRKIIVYTDSEYVQKGISEWIHGWKKRGWKTAAGTPVKNEDLWKNLDKAQSIHKIKWQWVRGHAGDPGNERADKLANKGVDTVRG